jgi:hypothetical protein
MAWMQWNHPDMPWQGGEIHIGDVEIVGSGSSASLRVKEVKKVAGLKSKISAVYPLFASNDTLLFTNDESGWISPWKYDVATGETGPLLSKALEKDFGEPMWVLGEQFPYAVVDGGNGAVWVGKTNGRDVMYHISVQTGEAKEIDTPYVQITSPFGVQGKDGEEALVFAGVQVDEKKTIVRVSLSSLFSGSPEFDSKLLPSADESTPTLSKDLVSVPQPITLNLPNNEGPLHIIFYGPHNPHYEGSNVEGEKPPCVISVHGGPTGHEAQGLSWRKQYFTSRGWAWYVCFLPSAFSKHSDG